MDMFWFWNVEDSSHNHVSFSVSTKYPWILASYRNTDCFTFTLKFLYFKLSPSECQATSACLRFKEDLLKCKILINTKSSAVTNKPYFALWTMVAVFWTAKEKSKYVNHGNLHFRYVLCWWKGRGDPAGVIIFSKK